MYTYILSSLFYYRPETTRCTFCIDGPLTLFTVLEPVRSSNFKPAWRIHISKAPLPPRLRSGLKSAWLKQAQVWTEAGSDQSHKHFLGLLPGQIWTSAKIYGKISLNVHVHTWNPPKFQDLRGVNFLVWNNEMGLSHFEVYLDLNFYLNRVLEKTGNHLCQNSIVVAPISVLFV